MMVGVSEKKKSVYKQKLKTNRHPIPPSGHIEDLQIILCSKFEFLTCILLSLAASKEKR